MHLVRSLIRSLAPLVAAIALWGAPAHAQADDGCVIVAGQQIICHR